MRDGRYLPLLRPNIGDEQHERAGSLELKIFACPFLQDRGSKRPETLTEFDLQIHHRLVPRITGIGKYAAASQRARSKLHPSLKPADHVLLRDEFRGLLQQLFPFACSERYPFLTKEGAYAIVPKFGTQERVLHHKSPGVLQKRVVHKEGRTDRTACIPGRRLYEDLPERGFLQHLAVGDAIQRDAPCHAKIFHPRLPLRLTGHLNHDRIRRLLERGRNILVELPQGGLRIPSRLSEQGLEFPPRHGQGMVIGKVFHVELEASIRLERDEFPHDEVVPPGFAVGSQPHHLILCAIHPEPKIIGKGGVEQPEGMGKMDGAG